MVIFVAIVKSFKSFVQTYIRVLSGARNVQRLKLDE